MLLKNNHTKVKKKINPPATAKLTGKVLKTVKTSGVMVSQNNAPMVATSGTLFLKKLFPTDL